MISYIIQIFDINSCNIKCYDAYHKKIKNLLVNRNKEIDKIGVEIETMNEMKENKLIEKRKKDRERERIIGTETMERKLQV